MKEKLNIAFEGQVLNVSKRNAIIPCIESADTSGITLGSRVFDIPEKCPYCGGMVEFDKNVVEEDMNNNLTLYDVLNHLDISYDEIEHEKVVTIEDAIKVSSKIDGFGTKSLFLTDGNHFYLVVLSEFKRANMKELAKLVGCKKLSFASNYDLDSTLGLEEGSVTPLGIMNDKYKEVTILIDKDLVNCKVLLHPNINTKTISITCADLIRYIEYFEHEYIIF